MTASPPAPATPGAEVRPQLTFFFPAYNEEENIERTVQLALEQIGPLVDGSLEVLAVDDGSSDRTPELADALARACGSITSRTAAMAAP